jgi:uncharacterized membrane protein
VESAGKRMTVWKSVRAAISRWRAGRQTSRKRALPRSNVHPAERLLCLAGSTWLGIDALHRDGLARAVLGGLALGLAWRGISGHSRVYAWLGVDMTRAPGVTDGRGVTLHTSMVIDRPLEEVFTMWRNLEAVAERMTHIE